MHLEQNIRRSRIDPVWTGSIWEGKWSTQEHVYSLHVYSKGNYVMQFPWLWKP